MSLLILLFLGLTYSDLLYTMFMLTRHGIEIELNPVIKWLSRKLGLATGVLVGISVPALLLLYFGIDFKPLLEAVTFARLMLFFLQICRLRVELATYRQRSYPASR